MGAEPGACREEVHMRTRSLRAALVALPILIALTALAQVAPARAQADARCFPETGFCIGGSIRRYWEQNGGLAVFGFPIAEQRTETVEGTWTGPVQWFERDRLEDHANQGLGVLAGRLGARALELQARPWQGFPGPAERPAECRFFPETGHNLCGVFLRYWERNGGLARFGYPLSEPLVESIGDWTGNVQYFERRRMEHHAELAGTPYEVLLGLLGRDVLNAASIPACGPMPQPVAFGLEPRIAHVLFRNALICPAQSYAGVPAAFQPFEHGTMIWLNLGPDNRQIVVSKTAGRPAPDPSYLVVADTWREGDPQPGGTAPAGLYTPQRGFGKIWMGSRGQGQWVGYATAPEQAEIADVQYFGGGGLLVHLRTSNQVWVFGPVYNQLAQG
jgi:hypothetical protein